MSFSFVWQQCTQTWVAIGYQPFWINQTKRTHLVLFMSIKSNLTGCSSDTPCTSSLSKAVQHSQNYIKIINISISFISRSIFYFFLSFYVPLLFSSLFLGVFFVFQPKALNSPQVLFGSLWSYGFTPPSSKSFVRVFIFSLVGLWAFAVTQPAVLCLRAESRTGWDVFTVAACWGPSWLWRVIEQHLNTFILCFILYLLPSSTGWSIWSSAVSVSLSITPMTLLRWFALFSRLLRLILGFLSVGPLSVVSWRPTIGPPGETGSLVVTFSLLFCHVCPAARNDNGIKNARRSAFNVRVLTALGRRVGKQYWFDVKEHEGNAAVSSCWLLLRLMELKSVVDKSSRSKVRFKALQPRAW